MIEECNISLTPEEKDYLDFRDGLVNKPLTAALIESYAKIRQTMDINYQSYQTTYNNIYVKPLKSVPYYESIAIRWGRNDSTLSSKLGISTNLTTEIVRLRELKSRLQSMNQNEGTNLVSRLDAYLTHSFFKSETKRLLEAKYSKQPTIELSKGKEAEAFKRIINPFKGKLVVVDFWATTCGPCIANIKQMFDTRKALANDPEVVFVFITDVSSSPQAAYDKFVKDQELVHTYRVSDGEFILFRNLFSFDGIPHYVLVGKEGNVINGNYNIGNAMNDIKKFLNR